MAQFDVYHNPNPASRGRTPYLLDVQSDVMEVLPTRLVCPVRPTAELPLDPIDQIHVPAPVDGRDCIVFVSELTAVPATLVTSRVGSLSAQRGRLIAAIDLLVAGF